MSDIPIRNKTQRTLRIMIEPFAQGYDIPPEEEVVVSGDFKPDFKGIEIDLWEDNFISLWVTSEVSVFLGGKKLEPLKEV